VNTLQITLGARSDDDLRALVERFGFYVHEHAFSRRSKGRVSVEAFGTPEQIEVARQVSRESARGGFSVSKPVDIGAQMARLARRRTALPDRIADNLREPSRDKPGWHDAYEQIERNLLANAGLVGPEWSRVFHLDMPTHGKGYKPIAVHMGTPIDSSKPTALILGGVHGNELIPPDVLCRLPGDIWNSIKVGSDLRFGRLTISAGDLRTMMKKINVIIVPCVNPDGRTAALANLTAPKPDWAVGRKNARQVDVNRNFDMLWDAKSYFHPDVFKSDNVIGFTPDKNTFRGPSAASENETRNIVNLLDRNPSIRCLLDIHAGTGSPVVLYNWGIDQNGTDPANRFPSAKGRRVIGLPGDAYREFVRAKPDGEDLKGLAETMSQFGNATKTVQWPSPWRPAQSFEGIYPTCASSDDYAYGRHVVSSQKPKVYGFTAEIGTFQSSNWEHVTNRWTEVAAAVVGFLLKMSTIRWAAPIRNAGTPAAGRPARKRATAKKKAPPKAKVKRKAKKKSRSRGTQAA